MPKKITIYHKEAGEAELYSIDAREALNKHPKEWSATPWPSDDGKGAKAQDSKPSDDGKGKN